MTYRSGAAIGVIVLAMTSSALSQSSIVQWSAVANAKEPKCPSGAQITITDGGDTLRYQASTGADATIKLGRDGAGSGEFRSPYSGRMMLEVPAGKGKRRLLLKIVNGTCEWIIEPTS